MEIVQNLELANLILEFMQLATEGHFLPLQNLFRQQPKLKTSFNLLKPIVQLVKLYYENMNMNNFQNLKRCLDVLIELVQGPSE